MKLILISDPHLSATPVSGRDPALWLEAALADAAATHADAAGLILLGDLSHDGAEQDYRHLKARLADLPWPTHPILGNHDDRAAFRSVFGGDPAAPVQACIAGGVPLYLMDSHEPGLGGGRLDKPRLDWLDAALSEAKAPGLLFLHHPPIRTELPGFDGAGLDNREGLADLLTRHPGKIRAIFFGHCHMPVSGLVSGVPAFGLPSTLIQSRPVFDAASFSSDHEAPPAYGVVQVHGPDLVLHLVRFSLPAGTDHATR